MHLKLLFQCLKALWTSVLMTPLNWLLPFKLWTCLIHRGIMRHGWRCDKTEGKQMLSVVPLESEEFCRISFVIWAWEPIPWFSQKQLLPLHKCFEFPFLCDLLLDDAVSWPGGCKSFIKRKWVTELRTYTKSTAEPELSLVRNTSSFFQNHCSFLHCLLSFIWIREKLGGTEKSM